VLVVTVEAAVINAATRRVVSFAMVSRSSMESFSETTTVSRSAN